MKGKRQNARSLHEAHNSGLNSAVDEMEESQGVSILGKLVEPGLMMAALSEKLDAASVA